LRSGGERGKTYKKRAWKEEKGARVRGDASKGKRRREQGE
jgi:hypothetical protein